MPRVVALACVDRFPTSQRDDVSPGERVAWRAEEDGMSPTPACTVILLRDGTDGLETFMLRRHRRSGFMPHMWVFPGGRVEPEDALDGCAEVSGEEAAATRFGFDGTRARATLVAGARETFEESGVWLGTGQLDPSWRGPLQRGDVSLAAVMTEHGARLDLGVMHPWARWVTPEGEGRRFDACFFVASVPEHVARARHDEEETVDSGWFTPQRMLAGDFSSFPLAPPTWWAVRELATYADVSAVMAASPMRHLTPVQPVRSSRDNRLSLLLPGDPDHPSPGRAGLPTRIDLTMDGWYAHGL
jgi:8-oxo-dGTP pyrophosphatase MutT (NUDIX family)